MAQPEPGETSGAAIAAYEATEWRLNGASRQEGRQVRYEHDLASTDGPLTSGRR